MGLPAMVHEQAIVGVIQVGPAGYLRIKTPPGRRIRKTWRIARPSSLMCSSTLIMMTASTLCSSSGQSVRSNWMIGMSGSVRASSERAGNVVGANDRCSGKPLADQRQQERTSSRSRAPRDRYGSGSPGRSARGHATRRRSGDRCLRALPRSSSNRRTSQTTRRRTRRRRSACRRRQSRGPSRPAASKHGRNRPGV